jgi:hypothetical protein
MNPYQPLSSDLPEAHPLSPLINVEYTSNLEDYLSFTKYVFKTVNIKKRRWSTVIAILFYLLFIGFEGYIFYPMFQRYITAGEPIPYELLGPFIFLICVLTVFPLMVWLVNRLVRWNDGRKNGKPQNKYFIADTIGFINGSEGRFSGFRWSIVETLDQDKSYIYILLKKKNMFAQGYSYTGYRRGGIQAAANQALLSTMGFSIPKRIFDNPSAVFAQLNQLFQSAALVMTAPQWELGLDKPTAAIVVQPDQNDIMKLMRFYQLSRQRLYWFIGSLLMFLTVYGLMYGFLIYAGPGHRTTSFSFPFIFFYVPIFSTINLLYTLPKSRAQTYIKDPLANLPSTFSIRKDGLTIETQNDIVHVNWNKIINIRRNKLDILFLIDRGAAYIIPKRYFNSELECVRFADMLEAAKAGKLDQMAPEEVDMSWPPKPRFLG